MSEKKGSWPSFIQLDSYFLHVQTLKNHTSSVIAMAADPSGRVLYSCGADSFLKYFDMKTGEQLKV